MAAKYWHFEVEDPKQFKRFATLDVGDVGGLVLRLGVSGKKGKKGGTTETVEFMFAKDKYPSEDAARKAMDEYLRRNNTKKESSNSIADNLLEWNERLDEWKKMSDI